MFGRFLFTILSLSLLEVSLLADHQPNCWTQQSAHAHYSLTQNQIQTRWEAFQKNREFTPFELDKADEILAKEFEEIRATRKKVWDLPEYEQAQHLIALDLLRAPGTAAFAYNNTVPYYNASTICLRGCYYIACEGPRSKDVPSFFRLLTSQRVTHLIRLTDAYENEQKKCHPYWEGKTHKNFFNKTYLEIPLDDHTYSLRSFEMSYWRDHQGVDPDKLLTMVLQVREELSRADNLLLVHCSAGVGRTGTFLAAIAITEAMEKGERFSIEEIVYRLSFQRVSSVAKAGQYITLHRLAERYFFMSGVGF